MAEAPLTLVESDIQGIVVYSYARYRFAAYLHVSFRIDGDPNAWLASLREVVTPAKGAAHEHERCNVAFTARGLRRLGLDAEELATLPRELQQGMHHPLRGRVLGDEGTNAREHWQFGGPRHPSLHALVMVFGRDVAALEALVKREEARLGEHGGVVVHVDRGRLDGKEPFGFADGIEQPYVDGTSRPKREHAVAIPPGEFVLGYPNAYGEVPAAPVGKGGFDLGKNGTYLVYRKLRQDVAGFWNAMFELAKDKEEPSAQHDEAIAVAARIVGRWPSGAPLSNYPDRDPQLAKPRPDFGFVDKDADGKVCPLGAHIRRANPRDALPPGKEESEKAVKRHRLLRRGRVYGPSSPAELADRRKADDQDRGLLFIAVNASLRRQFEFIQQTWINNPKFAGLHHERDPLVATIRDEDARFTVQGQPVHQRLQQLPQFVTTRGGAYYFMPGLAALDWLALRGRA